MVFLMNQEIYNSCVKYEQLTILGKDFTHPPAYIAYRESWVKAYSLAL